MAVLVDFYTFLYLLLFVCECLCVYGWMHMYLFAHL